MNPEDIRENEALYFSFLSVTVEDTPFSKDCPCTKIFISDQLICSRIGTG